MVSFRKKGNFCFPDKIGFRIRKRLDTLTKPESRDYRFSNPQFIWSKKDYYIEFFTEDIFLLNGFLDEFFIRVHKCKKFWVFNLFLCLFQINHVVRYIFFLTPNNYLNRKIERVKKPCITCNDGNLFPFRQKAKIK